MVKYKKLIVFIFLIFASISCVNKMDEKTALQKAIKVFPIEKYGSLINYQIEIVEDVANQCQWVVHFTQKGPIHTIGMDCMMLIEFNGEVTITDGR